MLLVVAEEEAIPGWLYPETFPGIPRPPEDSAPCPELEASAFAALWRVLEPTVPEADALEGQSSHCDVGVPHDAPEWVGRLNAGLVAALAAVPDHERWRIAQAWVVARLGKRPNQAELARNKELVKCLCDLARRAVASGRLLLLLEIA